METTFKNIGLLFTGIFLVAFWSFYHFFFKLFTSFHSTTFTQHLYEIAFLCWFVTLVGQPVLLRYKKITAQKVLMGLSFLLAPLVMFAIFYVSKTQYLHDISQMNESDAIARQAISLPNMVAFAVLCLLALFNKKNTFNHIRFIIAATLLLISLGLSYVFVMYVHFPLSMGVSLSFIITDLVLLTLIINDKIYGHAANPYLIALSIVLASHIVWFCMSYTTIWQTTASKFAQLFF